MWKEDITGLCDAVFRTYTFPYEQTQTQNEYAEIYHSKFRCIFLSPAQWYFYLKVLRFVSLRNSFALLKSFAFVCELLLADSPFTHIFQLYDSRVKTTDNSLLVNYLRGNLVGEYGKPLEILSKSNVLGLHFISSNSGYGIGKYGFNGTITAGEQMAECWPSNMIICERVIAFQL